MSGTNLSALELVIARAAEKHQASEQALSRARNRLQSSEAMLSQLGNYRGEYVNRLSALKQFTPDKLGNYHRFLGRLSLAMESQTHDVAQAGEMVERKQNDCLESLRRLKAVELLRNRRATAADNALRRQEQKDSDEFATRSTCRNRHCP